MATDTTPPTKAGGAKAQAGRFKARFATGGRLAPVEEWLTKNIEGQWTIQMDGVSDDMSKKNYSVIFAVEADRDSFKQRYILGKAAYEQARTPVVKQGFFARMFGGNPKPEPKPKSAGKTGTKKRK